MAARKTGDGLMIERFIVQLGCAEALKLPEFRVSNNGASKPKFTGVRVSRLASGYLTVSRKCFRESAESKFFVARRFENGAERHSLSKGQPEGSSGGERKAERVP
jgi:hypothetical protein